MINLSQENRPSFLVLHSRGITLFIPHLADSEPTPTWWKALNSQLATVSAVWWILTAEATHTASKLNARRSSPREPLASRLHGVPQKNAPSTHAVPWAEMVTRRMSLGRDPQSRRYTSSTHWGWAKWIDEVYLQSCTTCFCFKHTIWMWHCW